MSIEMNQEIKRWTAGGKASLVMDCHACELLGWHLARTDNATTAAAALPSAERHGGAAHPDVESAMHAFFVIDLKRSKMQRASLPIGFSSTTIAGPIRRWG